MSSITIIIEMLQIHTCILLTDKRTNKDKHQAKIKKIINKKKIYIYR